MATDSALAEKYVVVDVIDLLLYVPMECGELKSCSQPISFKIEDYNPSLREETRADQLYYKMNGNKIAIIINMLKFKNPAKIRYGAEKDIESLVKTFKHLNFEIVKLEDRPRQDLMDDLDKLAAADYKDFDCIAVIIMTHGQNDTLYCIDDLTFTLKEVEEKFLPGNCPELAGKPKLFFIQACRGSDIIKAYKALDARKEEITETQHLIPKSCDVLEFFSTEEGNLSARQEGTWFIQKLTKRLYDYGFKETLLNILTFVIHDVAISMEGTVDGNVFKQQPVLVSRLSKIVKFSEVEENLQKLS